MESHVDRVSTRMHAGDAAATIVDMARACRADLIAVGSRGLGPYKGFLLGSVSNFVAHYAASPVLVAKAAPGQERRFLLALDGSPRDGRVLGWLRELDLSAGARIHLVKIIPHPENLPGQGGESGEGTGEWIPPDEFALWGNSPEALEGFGMPVAAEGSRPGDRGGPAWAGGPGDPGCHQGVQAATADPGCEKLEFPCLVDGGQGGTKNDRKAAPCSLLIVRP